MGSLSLKISSNKLVIMDGFRDTVIEKRGGLSEMKISGSVGQLADDKSDSNWQNNKIEGRKDTSATVQIQFSSTPLKEVCGSFSKYIDFSLQSGHIMGSHAVLAEHTEKSTPLFLSEKHTTSSSGGFEGNPRSENVSGEVKQEQFMQHSTYVVHSESGSSRGKDVRCSTFQKDEKYIYSKIFVSRRRSVTKEEKDQTFQAARTFASDNPFFTVVMRPTHVYRAFYMSIPSSFVRVYLSSRMREMILETSGSQQWSVHCTFRKEYAGLRKGWSTFVWENNLEEGDVCVFERIDGSVFTFRVHIYRVLEEIVPLTKSYIPYIPKVPRFHGRKRHQQFTDHPSVNED